MAQETRNRRLEAERLQTRPEPDEVELEGWVRDGVYVVLAALATALAGTITVLAGAFKDFQPGDSRIATIAGGVALLVVAAGRIVRPGVTRTLWTALSVLAGLWLVIAAVGYTATTGAAFVDTICGAGAVIVALLTLDAADPV